MAGIDKTYAKTWREYESLLEWAKDKEFTCPNGMKLYPINSVFKWDENDKKDIIERSKSFKRDRPDEEFEFLVMNTSQSMDYFLIKQCPLEFVQNRMKQVYGEEYIEQVLNGISEFDNYKRDIGTKVKIIKYPKWGNKSNLYEPRYWMKFIEVDIYNKNDMCSFCWYNEKLDCWVENNELGYYTSSMCHKNINSVKAMIRQIRKWKLPKGSVVKWAGRYIDNEFKFLVY